MLPVGARAEAPRACSRPAAPCPGRSAPRRRRPRPPPPPWPPGCRRPGLRRGDSPPSPASPQWRSRDRRRRGPLPGPPACRGRPATGRPSPSRAAGSPSAIWLLAKARPKVLSTPMTSPVERISGPRRVSTPGKRSNGSTASLTLTWSSTGTRPTTSGRSRPSSRRSARVCPTMTAGRHHGQRHAGGLGHEGDRAAGPGIGLEDVDLPVLDGELHVDETADGERLGQGPGVTLELLEHVVPQGLGRQGAGRVARVHPGLLDVLHDPGDEDLAGAVAHGVDVDLDRVLQEPVHQHRPLGRDPALAGQRARGHGLHDPAHAVVVVDDLHGPPAQHVARAEQHRVADLPRHGRAPRPSWWPCPPGAGGCRARGTGRSTARGPRPGRWRPGWCRAPARAAASRPASAGSARPSDTMTPSTLPPAASSASSTLATSSSVSGSK